MELRFKNRKSAESEPPDSRQHFDVWSFTTADKDAGAQSYFGALPPQVIENLLSMTRSTTSGLAAIWRNSERW